MTRQYENDWHKWTVAVTGVSARQECAGPGCAVARCLRESPDFAGRVIGLGYDVLDAGLYAKDFVHGGYLIPSASSGDDALLSRLASLHRIEGFDAIIPCLDAEIPTYIRLTPKLAKMGIKVLLPNREQFSLRGRDNLVQLCAELGVRTAESRQVADPQFFNNCDGFSYPLMIKGSAHETALVYNATQAKAVFFKYINGWGHPVLVQRVIHGDEFVLAAVGDGRGNMLGEVIMRKRGNNDKDANAWAGVTVADDEISEVAARLVKGLNWRGPIEVQVIRDSQGKVYLTEVNPRFPAWIFLSHAVGRNLPITLLEVLAGETDHQFGTPVTGTFFIRYTQDLIVPLREYESMFVMGGLGGDNHQKRSA
jgi:carbamoyl-phosphate synthase large subunit